MKRLWIASAILLAVFSATLVNAAYLTRFTGQLTSILNQAETQAKDGDWVSAGQLTQEALDRWHTHDQYLYAVLRHSNTDAVRTGFREVLAFISYQEAGEYSAASARLITQIELLSEMERFSLQNLL